MTVKYFATIRSYTGETARRVDDAPGTLRELLAQLAQRYGASFRRAVFAADGDQGGVGADAVAIDPGAATLNDQIIILVNGRNVLFLNGLDTPLGADDEVSIFPMVAGG